jgi:hypothetical protein
MILVGHRFSGVDRVSLGGRVLSDQTCTRTWTIAQHCRDNIVAVGEDRGADLHRFTRRALDGKPSAVNFWLNALDDDAARQRFRDLPRGPVTGRWHLLILDGRLPPAARRLRTAGRRLSIDRRRPAIVGRLTAADCQLIIADRRLTPAGCRPITAG